jgi:uncharacterized RDD family membrane protein YckC
LHSPEGAGSPLADFDLATRDRSTADDTPPALDLDRLIGEAEPATVSKTPALPLFGGEDDAPLITTARPPRAPLSVRRTTPEIPRTRSRSVTPRFDEGELEFPIESSADESPVSTPDAVVPTVIAELLEASAGRRLSAAAIDIGLLAAINVAVVYLTLALAGLAVEQMSLLPTAPLVGFLAILDGGYLVAFIAASGQTIGKMVTGIRVVRDDGSRVDIPGAVLRALGCGVSLVTLGLGYLPAFVGADRRALQDRISRTRVVSAG